MKKTEKRRSRFSLDAWTGLLEIQPYALSVGIDFSDELIHDILCLEAPSEWLRRFIEHQRNPPKPIVIEMRPRRFSIYSFAKHLGVSANDVRQLIKDGDIKAIQHRSYGYLATEIEESALPVAAQKLLEKYQSKAAQLTITITQLASVAQQAAPTPAPGE